MGDNIHGFETEVTRFYVDIRPYVPDAANQKLQKSPSERKDLPLLNFLPQDVQDSVTRFLRLPDRYMALASALMKYLFIHRTAKIPWSQVKIARTPKPHLRPYWDPPSQWHGDGFDGLEFNVSHQAGMVVLVGCKSPKRSADIRLNRHINPAGPVPTAVNPDPTTVREVDSEIDNDTDEEVRLGVDVACTSEPPRSPDLSTQVKLDEWVDVFAEMFSDREREDMKNQPVMRGTTGEMAQKARRFYTCWALKEAYIKLVGEGLIADWLRQLEFRDVIIPAKPDSRSGTKWVRESDVVEAGLKVLFKGKDITDTLRITLEGFEETFVVATMMRGVSEKSSANYDWTKINFEKDVRPCAEGKCSCLL